MNQRKEFKTVLLLALFSIMFSFTAEAFGPKPGSQNPFRNDKPSNSRRHVQPPANPGNAVGVPLDGGLLALLAGAGITYFAARRKKRKES